MSEENPLDKFELSERLKSIDMFNEQSKDKDIQKALNWLRKKDSPISMCGSYDLQKYHKQLGRLILDGNILCRKFYDHLGFYHTDCHSKTTANRTYIPNSQL